VDSGINFQQATELPTTCRLVFNHSKVGFYECQLVALDLWSCSSPIIHNSLMHYTFLLQFCSSFYLYRPAKSNVLIAWTQAFSFSALQVTINCALFSKLLTVFLCQNVDRQCYSLQHKLGRLKILHGYHSGRNLCILEWMIKRIKQQLKALNRFHITISS